MIGDVTARLLIFDPRICAVNAAGSNAGAEDGEGLLNTAALAALVSASN